MTGEKCQNCKFFLHQKLTQQGACRRYPPTAMIMPMGNQLSVIAQFPEMKVEGWCGEFKPGILDS